MLIADDDDAMRIAVTYILESAGFKVEQARNGMEALALAKTGRSRAVVLDIEMPSMDGLRALSLIRRNAPTASLPVLMLSQQASPQNVRACVQLGACEFVVKQNFNPKTLIEKLRKHAGGASARTSKSASATDPGPVPAASAAASAPIDAPMDQATWKQKVAALGRCEREATKQMLAELPSPVVLPDILRDVTAAMGKGEAEIARVIHQDPMLTLRVLGAANKSQETSQKRADQIVTALRWLGDLGVRNIVTEMLEKAPTSPKERAGWIALWWRHSLAVAAVAAELAMAMEIDPLTARAAGLGHDLGRLLLLASPIGDKAASCYDLARQMIFPTSMAEQMLLGQSHKQAGQEHAERLGLSSLLSNVCHSHDLDEAARNKLAPPDAALAAVVNAANQIAKAAGFGSLPNDDLQPLPNEVAPAATELELPITQALQELETLAQFRVGSNVALPAMDRVSLAGITVAFVSPQASPWNPFQRVLHRAGATLTAFSDPLAFAEKAPLHDVTVLDLMHATLNLELPKLRRLCLCKSVADSPKLLLARRSDEPELIVGQSGLPLNVYPSPIRSATLVQTVRRLAGAG